MTGRNKHAQNQKSLQAWPQASNKNICDISLELTSVNICQIM